MTIATYYCYIRGKKCDADKIHMEATSIRNRAVESVAKFVFDINKLQAIVTTKSIKNVEID